MEEEAYRHQAQFDARAGDHAVTLRAQGGARLWIGARLMVDAWDGPAVDRTITVTSDGGPLRWVLEYNDPGGRAGVELDF